jgi:hypothetical protein
VRRFESCRGHEQKGCAVPIRGRQFGNQRHPDGQLAFRRLTARFEVQRGQQIAEVLIANELVWRGDEGFTTAAVCRATLVNGAGDVVWEGSHRVEPLWRPNELKRYPYRTEAFVLTGGERVDAVRASKFTCESL